VGKRTDYKFTYFISFTLVIPSLMKSIAVCIVILMAGSSLLFFGLPFSHITFKCGINTSSPLNVSFPTSENILRNFNNLYRALEQSHVDLFLTLHQSICWHPWPMHSNLAALLVSTHHNFSQHDSTNNITSGRGRERVEMYGIWVQVISVVLVC
jgi:hypothetical protein